MDPFNSWNFDVSVDVDAQLSERQGFVKEENFDDEDEDDDDDEEMAGGEFTGGASGRGKQNPLQREKNREAVRNCRKRKKEHTMQLKERINELLEENAKLRLELQLGGDERPQPQPMAIESEQGLVAEMLELVRTTQQEEGDRPSNLAQQLASDPGLGAPKSDAEVALRRKIQLYMERHQDHGRDRQKAIGFILGRLQRLVEPESLTKQYLHLMTTESESGGRLLDTPEWAGLKKDLNLTIEQWKDFSQRKRYAKRLRTELDCAFEKMESIVKRCRRNKKVGDSLNELTTILKPEQFARFVVWVHSNPACKDILDELWGKLMSKCDVAINREISMNPSLVRQIKRFQENSAALSIRLFSIADPRIRVSIAKLCVHPDVVLVDANNNVDKRGIKSVTRYMSYVTNAFDTQSCEKTKSLRALSVEEKSITTDQQDDKIQGIWRLSGVYIGKLRPPGGGASPRGDSQSPAGTSSPFGLSMQPEDAGTFSLPSSVSSIIKAASSSDSTDSASRPQTGDANGTSSRPDAKDRSPPVGGFEPLLSREEQLARTVSFNVIVEFSFADPVRPELITEMIISWDAMSLVAQIFPGGFSTTAARGVLPPPNASPQISRKNSSAETIERTVKPAKDEAPATLDAQFEMGMPTSKGDTGEISALTAEQAESLLRAQLLAEEEAKHEEEQKAQVGTAEIFQQNAAELQEILDMEEPSAKSRRKGAKARRSSQGPQESPAVRATPPEDPLAAEFTRERHFALQLADLFRRADDPERVQLLAQQILDPRCVLNDVHMATSSSGLTNCVNYARRLRRVFPKFDIDAVVVTVNKATQPSRLGGETRLTRSLSALSQSSGLSSSGVVVEMTWNCIGEYAGKLVDTPLPFTLKGEVVATVWSSGLGGSLKITDIKVELVSKELLTQLGLIRNVR